ncbi:MAG: VWA domain-containing protein [Deltaproteobacteria bacterium]|jgi:serine/threonine-protein kinase PpkA|nr:VWA domain-containing protein [Deltaproteobacteria bacterium]
MTSGRFFPRLSLGVLLIAGALVLFSASGLFAQKKPLLVEGKSSIYQRLVTHPGATPLSGPGGAEVGQPLLTFTVLYVYDMKFEGGGRWYQVGADSKGTNLFWLNFEQVTLWNNNMTVMFAEKSGRPQPVLFFKTGDYLRELVTKPGIGGILEGLTADFTKYFESGSPPPDDFPVLAKEPGDEEGAVSAENFYLMPILAYDNGIEGLTFLEVVAINPARPDHLEPINNPKVGIAFVIDTTISMREYIEATKDICRYIFDLVEKSGKAADTYLAFVAFRSSVEKSPGLEYTTKLVSDFTPATEKNSFLSALAGVEEAKASSHSFNEDSVAGLSRALDLDWNQFNGGVIILITDAGPLDLSDPNRATPDSASTIFERAKEKGAHIVPIHLKTPQGRNNHGYAEENYRRLATEFGGSPTYIPLQVSDSTGGAGRYAEFMEGFADTFRQALDSGGPGGAAPPDNQPSDASMGSRVGGYIGYSIYLNWLGRSKNTEPMTVVRSWISDVDLGVKEKNYSTNVRAVDVCILLTRDQLSALSETLTQLTDLAENAIGDDKTDFFSAVLNSSLMTSTDPKTMELTPASRLGEMGVLDEYLDGLPYPSKIMTLTKADWDAMPAPQQMDFIKQLRSKISAYRKINDNLTGWYRNSEDPGEWLCRVPLTLLP